MAFNLQYKNNTFPFKGSPVKQVTPVDNFLSKYLSGSKIGVTFGDVNHPSKAKHETSLAGTYGFSPKKPWYLHGGSIGAKYETSSREGFGGGVLGEEEETKEARIGLESRAGGTGAIYFGDVSGRHRESDARFLGSLSGDVTYGLAGKSKGKIGYSGRIGLGLGRHGTAGCVGGACSCAGFMGRGIEAFGEYGSKHSARPGARVGLAGRYGWLSGSASYGLQSGGIRGSIGLKIPINR